MFKIIKENENNDSIVLTDLMLSKIPLPKGDIVFDDEVELSSFKNVYGNKAVPVNGKIRVIIANCTRPDGADLNMWQVNGYYIDEKEGFCGYTSKIDKENCKTVKDVLDKIVHKGEFNKYGMFGRNFEYANGVWYPNESNTVKNPLIKSARVLNFGYCYADTFIYGELIDNNWFTGYIQDRLHDEPYVDMLRVYDSSVPQRMVDVLVGKNRRRDAEAFKNKFVKEHSINYSNTKKLEKEIIFRLEEFKANNSRTVLNNMNHSYD